MEIKELLEIHENLTNEAREIMRVKNMDYSSGNNGVFQNFRASEWMGISGELGLLMRVMDKMCRMKTFINEGKLNVPNEGFKDAVLDCINYFILLYGMYEEKNGGKKLINESDEEIFNREVAELDQIAEEFIYNGVFCGCDSCNSKPCCGESTATGGQC